MATRPIQPYLPFIFAAFLILILAEFLWARWKKRPVHNGRETLANLVIFLGNQVSHVVLAGWLYFVLACVYQRTPLKLPETAATLVLAIVFVDFLYYWEHRLLHEVKPLWAFHEVHHSSLWYNLTTSFRLNWLAPLITPFFFLPAAALGVAPRQILIFFATNLVFQFWLHTEAVPALGPLEGWINTPSAHRVHHGSNPCYIDKNFGGILMVWDRLFATYAPEREKVRFGTTRGFRGHGPVRAVLQGFVDLAKGSYATEAEVTQAGVAGARR